MQSTPSPPRTQGTVFEALLLWVSRLQLTASPRQIPSIVWEEGPWHVTEYRAVAGNDLYSIVEPVYKPHGGTFTYSFWVNGERVWPGINIENLIVNGRILGSP